MKNSRAKSVQGKVKVSVLVPIYNVEKYLSQCLDSIVNQTLKEIEIICINDGSTDGSPQIIKEYAKRDSRVVVINKKNSGYGDSMNRGLEKATGEYIGIVESDDFAELDMFEKLYDLAEENRADAVKSNFYFYHSGTNQRSNIIAPDEVERIINPSDDNHIFLQMATIWSGLYRRDFLKKNGIKFLPTPGASYQDTSFNFKVWASTSKAYFTDKAYLHYRTDNESSSVKSRGKVFCVCDELAEMQRYLVAKKLFDKLNAVFIQRKFDIYFWNFNRLSWKNAYDFLMTMNREFKQHEQKNELVISLLDVEQKVTLRRIMSYPRLYLIVKNTKALINRILFKIRPAHRRESRIIEFSDQIIAKNIELEAKLDELKERLDGAKR